MSWKTNAIMTWYKDSTEHMITDHGRTELSMNTERIGTDRRMSNGTLRRFLVGNKRSWNTTWSNIPSVNSVATGMKTADGGLSGSEIEDFYDTTPGKFRLILRNGSASGVITPPAALTLGPAYEDDNFYAVDVMITEFSRDVVSRGVVDLWNITISLEEV